MQVRYRGLWILFIASVVAGKFIYDLLYQGTGYTRNKTHSNSKIGYSHNTRTSQTNQAKKNYKNFKIKLSEKKSFTNNGFEDILFVVVYHFPYYRTIPLIESMYSDVFDNMLICGPRSDESKFDPRSLTNQSRYLEADVDKGHLAYICMFKAMEMYPTFKGYFYINDDTLINWWNFIDLDRDKLWSGYPFYERVAVDSKPESVWSWWRDGTHGVRKAFRSIKDMLLLDKKSVLNDKNISEKSEHKEFHNDVETIDLNVTKNSWKDNHTSNKNEELTTLDEHGTSRNSEVSKQLGTHQNLTVNVRSLNTDNSKFSAQTLHDQKPKNDRASLKLANKTISASDFLNSNGNGTKFVYAGRADVYYVPVKYRNMFIKLSNIFYKHQTFLEMAVPTIFESLENHEDIIETFGVFLDMESGLSPGEQTELIKYNPQIFFIHPIKLQRMLPVTQILLKKYNQLNEHYLAIIRNRSIVPH